MDEAYKKVIRYSNRITLCEQHRQIHASVALYPERLLRITISMTTGLQVLLASLVRVLTAFPSTFLYCTVVLGSEELYGRRFESMKRCLKNEN